MSSRTFIRFERNGSRVRVLIDTLLPGIDCSALVFEMDRGCDIDAELIRARFDAKLGELARKLAEKAYNDGYRDGRAKRGKRAWQPCWLGGEPSP